MSQSAASSVPAGSPVPSTPDTRLRGRWLPIARVGWVAGVAFILGLFLLSLPTYLAHVQTVCVHQPCAGEQLTLKNAHALQALGISVGSYAALTVTLTLLIALVEIGMGGVLAWRKPDDWMALLVALLLVQNGASVGIGNFFTNGHGYALPATLLNFLAGPLFFLVFLLFPSGRFVPRWAWCLAFIFLIISVTHQFFSDWPFNLASWSDLSGGLIFTGSILSVPIAQIYRYRRVSTPVQRQQTKWILFGITVLIMVLLGQGFVEAAVFPALAGSLYDPGVEYVITVTTLFIPLSFTIAILRYRLWDIDALINRTLVYGLLTGILGTVYAGLIIGLQSLAGAIVGQESQPVVIVISTLAIATLVLPLRRLLQALIDRRFYRRKYDAEKILAAFSTSLQNEVDLSHLREQVLAVVQETMQPAQVSLWLRQPEQDHPNDQAYRPQPHSQVFTKLNPD
jgi:hypothetical protein